MKLAKYRTASGEVGVGSVSGDQLTPLAPSDDYASLTDILEAEAPGQVAAALMESQAEVALATAEQDRANGLAVAALAAKVA